MSKLSEAAEAAIEALTPTMEEVADWVSLVDHPDYEISTTYPHQIKKRSNGRIIAESEHKTGYIRCWLNGNCYQKHRLIAKQFVFNDDPEHKTEVDHIDHNRSNNHIENLRWVSSSDNQKNKTSHHNVTYEYVDKIDDDAIEVNDYGDHHFEFYYYVESEDSFYFYNGINYRKLHVNIQKKRQVAYVKMMDTNNKYVCVCLNKFKRLYDIEF